MTNGRRGRSWIIVLLVILVPGALVFLALWAIIATVYSAIAVWDFRMRSPCPICRRPSRRRWRPGSSVARCPEHGTFLRTGEFLE